MATPRFPKPHRDRDGGVELAVAAAGGFAALARFLGITTTAVQLWSLVPPTHVLKIAQKYGLTPHELRPDLYPESSWVGRPRIY